MLKTATIGLSDFPFCHDFAMTERYAVFFMNSVVAEGLGRVFLGSRSLADVLVYQPQRPIRILVVELESLALVQEIEVEPGLVAHFGNAYEHG